MSNDFIDVTINNKTYHLIHLISEEDKEQGLMGITSLSDDEGALFDYSDDPQPALDFWMHDTVIPLDICFINESGVIISVKQGVPESDDYISESSDFIAYVIEVNVNSGIKAGDKTSLGITDPDENDNLEDEYPDLPINHLVIYGSDGTPQGYLQGNERIFSRKSTKVIIRKAKRAFSTNSDADYKALGRYIFKEMKAQDSRPAEFVEN